MRNTLLFKTSRAFAIASMLGITLYVPMHRSVNAAPRQLDTAQRPSIDPYERAVESNSIFWLDTWDLEFVEGRMGMMLTQETGPYTWSVEVLDAQVHASVAEGTFQEIFRLYLPELTPSAQELDEAGLWSLERYVVAGVTTGSTGYRTAMTAIVHELTVAQGTVEGDLDVIRVLTPLRITDDGVSAILTAFDFDVFIDYVGEAQETAAARNDQLDLAGYWSCVGLVLLCETYTLACFAAAPACYVACTGICASPGILFCLSCIIACAGGVAAICQTAYNCWQTASTNGCVPW